MSVENIEASAAEQNMSTGGGWRNYTQELAVIGLVLAVGLVSALTLDRFAAWSNLLDIVRSSSTLGVLSIGAMLVVITRGLDLSVVAIMAVSSGFALQLMIDGMGQIPALLVGLLLSMILGAINGVLVAYVDIPPLFVTIATALLFLGIFRFFYFQADVASVPPSATIVRWLGSARPLGIPAAVILFIVAGLVVGQLLRLNIGRYLLAIGDNPDTARLAGLPVRPLVLATYVGAGVLAFIAGLNLAGTASVYDLKSAAAGTLLYDVIAVVVIGGVSLAGGRGTVLGVAAAALLLGLVGNVMTLLDFDTIEQALAKSFIVLIAIVLDRILHPRDEEHIRVGDL